jgi:hypothetical protein
MKKINLFIAPLIGEDNLITSYQNNGWSMFFREQNKQPGIFDIVSEKFVSEKFAMLHRNKVNYFKAIDRLKE